LDNNQIQSLSPTVKNLTKLEQLWLGGNFLRQLPTELGQLTSLIELHLGRNKIHHVSLELGNLNRLVSLNLSYNRLIEIPSQILDLRQLEALNLNGNVRRRVATDFGKLLTYRKQIEQKSQTEQRERKLAEEANRIKGQFLSQISHEIRTPMDGVIGSLDLIDQQTLNPEQIQHIERAKNSGQYLIFIINEILQFSELGEGKTTYHHANRKESNSIRIAPL